jgi:hypothetical protein
MLNNTDGLQTSRTPQMASLISDGIHNLTFNLWRCSFLSILPFPRIERLCQVSWIQGAIDSRYYESDCSGYGGCSGSYSRLAVPEHDTWCPTGTSPLLDTANTLQVSALKPRRVDAIFLLVGWGVNMPSTTNKQVMITTPNRLHFYQKKPLGIDASVQHRSYGSKPRCRDPVSLHIGEETTEHSNYLRHSTSMSIGKAAWEVCPRKIEPMSTCPPQHPVRTLIATPNIRLCLYQPALSRVYGRTWTAGSRPYMICEHIIYLLTYQSINLAAYQSINRCHLPTWVFSTGHSFLNDVTINFLMLAMGDHAPENHGFQH